MKTFLIVLALAATSIADEKSVEGLLTVAIGTLKNIETILAKSAVSQQDSQNAKSSSNIIFEEDIDNLFNNATTNSVPEKNTLKSLNDATNQFSTKLFSEVARENSGKNFAVSGLSAMFPLAQLALASVGESHDEILSVLGVPNDNVTKEVFSLINRRVSNVTGVNLKIANRIYLPEGGELNHQFAAVSRDVFRSDVDQVNFFNSAQAAAVINKWVANNTNNRITDLIEAKNLGPSTQAVLVNALYFKGNWKTEFEPEMTADDDFYVSKHKIVKVPYMYQQHYFKYGYSSDLRAKLLELEFEGDDTSFIVVLPDEIDGLQAIQDKLLRAPEALDRATASLHESEITVLLPKFKIETIIDLQSALSKIGITKLFDARQARLENFLVNDTRGFSITDAVQKVFFEINEQGAEGAAASSFLSTRMDPPKFMADRPFYFVLRMHSVPLFSGVYSG